MYDGMNYQNFLNIEKIVNTWKLDENFIKYKNSYDESIDLLLSCIA